MKRGVVGAKPSLSPFSTRPLQSTAYADLPKQAIPIDTPHQTITVVLQLLDYTNLTASIPI
jgi:hypothetical protein